MNYLTTPVTNYGENSIGSSTSLIGNSLAAGKNYKLEKYSLFQTLKIIYFKAGNLLCALPTNVILSIPDESFTYDFLQ